MSSFDRTIKKFNGHLPIYTGISTHFHKESGEHNDGYNQIEILIILAGIFFMVHSSNLLACHESNFDGEELLVSTSFFGSHTRDNKMGKAVSVRENIKILTGNITQATTITSNYTIDTSRQLQTATGVLPISRSSSMIVTSR